MGVVYEAEQISLGRRVALKVLPRQVSSDRMIQERFRREARAAARLHHTNIVPVYEVGQDGDVRFYAMQFIQGQGLDAGHHRAAAAPRPGRIRAQDQGGLRGPVAPAPRRALPPGHRGPDTRRRGRGQRGVAVHSDRSVRPWRPAPGAGGSLTIDAGQGPRRRPRDTDRDRDGKSRGRIRPRTDAHRDRECDRRRHNRPRRAHPPAPALSPSASPSSSSAILPGGTQLSSVESGRRAFFRSLAQIGRQVAGGLAYAHARGIVHRDIKPSNLLLDTEGVVWIADFGLAKGDDEGLTQTGDILGTLRYMAPERFRGEGDARADVYALGLTLYELLTLRPGFDSSDRLKLIEQIKTEEPQRPRAVDARIPRDLETIVLKAIEKDPKARYQSAEAMGEDLGRFLADEPIRARQVSAVGAILAVVPAKQTGGRDAGRRCSRGARAGHGRLDLLRPPGQPEGERLANARTRPNARRECRGWPCRRRTARPGREAGSATAACTWRRSTWPSRPGKRAGWTWCSNTSRRSSRSGRRIPTCAASSGTISSALCQLDLRPCTVAASVAFSPDGRSSPRPAWTARCRLWDDRHRPGVHTLRGHAGRVIAGGVQPRRPHPRLRRPADHTVKLWDAATGREVRTLRGHTAAVLGVAYSPDGRTLASAGDDRTVRIWDAATGQEVRTLRGHTASVMSVAYSPDGRTLASASDDRTVKLWDAATGQRVRTLRGHIGCRLGVAFSPDGRTLASASRDHTVKLWDVATGQELRTLAVTRPACMGVAFSPTAAPRLRQPDRTVKLWDAATGQVVHNLRGHADDVLEVAFSPDGRRIASASGTGP